MAFLRDKKLKKAVKRILYINLAYTQILIVLLIKGILEQVAPIQQNLIVYRTGKRLSYFFNEI
jgi:hypothetical protein